MKNLVYAGQTVELNVLEGDYKGLYRTKIEDVGQNSVTVLSVFDKSKLVSLRIDTEVEVIFFDESSTYAFNARIVDRISSPIYAYILSISSEVKKIQRRKYFRVPVIYPLSVSKIILNKLSEPIKGSTLNLSGGGMLFQLSESLDVGTRISVELNLPNLKVNTYAKVVRTTRDEENKFSIMGAEFEGLSVQERDKIIHFVLNIQRNLLRKGLI